MVKHVVNGKFTHLKMLKAVLYINSCRTTANNM